MADIAAPVNYFDANLVQEQMAAFFQSQLDKENNDAVQVYAGKAEAYLQQAQFASDNKQPLPARPLPPLGLTLVINRDSNNHIISMSVQVGPGEVCPPVHEFVAPPAPPAGIIKVGVKLYGNWFQVLPGDTFPNDQITPVQPDGHKYQKVAYPFGAWYLQVA